jgi:hypothetical protein
VATQHHGDGDRSERSELLKRFEKQLAEDYRRRFLRSVKFARSAGGRTGADDDAELTYAVVTDHRHRTIVIRFAHAIDWIGLDVRAATELRDNLSQRLRELRGITV